MADAKAISSMRYTADNYLSTVVEEDTTRPCMVPEKQRLGLVIDRRFHEENRWCSATTFHLVEALKSGFDCVYIQNQRDYEEKLGDVDLLISMEPGWASPVLELTRTQALRGKLAGIPSYIFYSDPHANKWREDYFLKNGLDYVLSFYLAPFRHHFRRIQPAQLIHFPWAIPDCWISDAPIVFRGQSKICCFGGQKGEAYELRNWCRSFEFVESATNSGVENKVMSESEYIDWLQKKDAAIAAGSDSPKYRLTVPKYFEIAAAGSLLFAQQTDDLALLGFEHKQNCIIFDRSDFEQLAKEYLTNPKSYLQIRQAGRELIRQRHSLSVRIKLLTEHIKQSCFRKQRRRTCQDCRGRTDSSAQPQAKTVNSNVDVLSGQENKEFEFWFERVCVASIVQKARQRQLFWKGQPLEWDAAYEILAYHEFCGGSVSVEQLLFMSNNRYQLLDQIWPKGPLSRERVEAFYQASAKILPWGHGLFIADHQTHLRRKTWLKRVRLLKMLKERKVESLCDYGAGGGHTTLLAKAMGFGRVVHHEYSVFHPYVAWRAEKMNLSQQSACRFEMSPAEYPLSLKEPVDAVICTDVAEHVWDPIKMLDEIRGALRPGGLLIWCSCFGEGLSCHLHPDLKGKEEEILKQTGFQRVGDLGVSFGGHSGLYQAVPHELHQERYTKGSRHDGSKKILTACDEPSVCKKITVPNSMESALEQNQWLSPAEIERYQWQDLKSLLEHSYKNVPFYRRRFDSIGLNLHDIRSMDDFHKIPILKKADIQQNLDAMKATNCPAEQIIRDATGGSTGQPLVFYRDLNAKAWIDAAALRFRRWMGYGPESKLALIWGADRDVPESYPPNQRWLNSFNCSDEQIEKFVAELVQWKPDAIRAYASSLYMVASYIKSKGLQAPHPKAIESAAEKLWDWQRKVVEQVFGCKVFEMYGSREIPSLACECECHNGMHIFSDLRLIEVIKDGRPAKPGEEGSIIVTDLVNYGMPFIRYEIGDVGVISEENCPCGRGFGLLKEIKGRITSTIRTPDGRRIHGEYFAHLFYNVPGVKAFQVHQTKLDEVIVSVQPDKGFDRNLIELVMRKMRLHLGDGMHVKWKCVDDIPVAASGKRHFTISDVSEDFGGVGEDSQSSATAISVAHNPAGKNILFIVDQPGWAHDFKTDNLIRRLGDSFNMTKRYKDNVAADDIQRADMVVVYYWKQFNHPNMSALLEVFIQNKHKLLIGICSHQEMAGGRDEILGFMRKLARGIFVNSMLLYKEFSPCFEVPVFCTPNGVDTEFFRPAPSRQAHQKLRVGWAGSIKNHGNTRGYHDFIVPATNSVEGVELVVAAREDKWRNRDEMLEFYRSIDVYICASTAEGTPNPCLEAAACGAPLLTTRVGNMPELIEDGKNGFFIERDVNDIKNKLILLRDNPALRLKMSAEILKSIQVWDWNKQAENYRKMFERIMLTKGHAEPNESMQTSPLQAVGSGEANCEAVKYFLKAQDEFNKERFEEAFELMHKYKTSIDYRSLPRFIRGEKTKEVDVSVVIVTYDRTEDVRKCIESVEKQQTPREKYEVIVVDNGLTDEGIIKPLCDQYIKCPANLYLSEGRNIGACFARGGIVAFLDDDAFVGPDYIGSIKEAFNRYDIFGFRGKVLPVTDTEANRQAFNYDRGDGSFCTFCDQEGNSAFLTGIYLDINGMDPLLFGAEGSDLSYRIGKRYKCFNKIIYWPRAVIYHDATAGAAKKARQEWYKVNENYLNLKHGVSISAMRRVAEKEKLPAKCINKNETSTTLQMSETGPKFSFVMIVLNGVPFIEYSLKSIYDFANEIIIVEGAVEKCMFAANPDGSSTDGTVEFIKSFPDPAGKIKLIQGKWLEKCDMQNEALKRITGDYVWLIDSDEVYKGEDLEKIRSILKKDPTITQVNFIPDSFWKGLDYIFTSPKFYEPRNHYRRLFKYVPGAVFTTHRPPTMVWPGIDKTTEQMKLLDGTATRRMGVKFYHYSYVLDKQVKQKIELYRRYGWGKSWGVDLEQWYEQCYMKWKPWNRVDIDAKYPIWTGDKSSHTEEFKGTHPEVMMDFVLEEAAKPSSGKAMEHVIAAVEQLKSSFVDEKISAIETGTIRSFYEEHFSTYHISRSLGDRGKLISVDISEDSLRVSKQLCHELTNIEFIQSDSIKYLDGLEKQKFHLAFLDSVNDKDFIFNEFQLIIPMMAEGGIVIIDDAGICPVNHRIDTSVPAQKGHRVWEFIQSCGLKAELLTTPCNHGTQIKIEMTADNIHKINAGLCGVGGDIRKVLIVRSDSIGDLVIFGGSFQYFRQLYSNCHITLVVADKVGDLAQANPYIDEIITFNRTKITSDQEYAGLFIRQIQSGKYDIAICPAHSRDRVSDFIAMNSGAKERITTSGDTANQTAEQIENNNKYFTRILPASEGIKLETFRNEEFLRQLGAKIEGEYTPAAWFTKDDVDFAESLLERIRVENPILIAPFAQSPIRDWRIDGWSKLISSHRDIPVIICGLEANKLNADKIILLTDHPNVHNLCGETSVRQLAALISRSRLCVSPCTAPAHLAVVAGCPHVVLVGGGHFGRFWPYSELTKMVYKKMDCFGCNWKCKYGKDIKCIKAISFEMVEEAVRASLGIDGKPAVTPLSEVRSDNKEYKYLVSAIVSTYNSEKFIRGCLEDLENQTIADRLEIIVVNSGSQQNEEAIVKEFQAGYSNIVYIKTEQKEGVYAAWNRAVRAASGRFLTNANTDDRHRRDALEILSNELINNPEVALVYGDQICTDTPNATFEKHNAVETYRQPDYSRERLLLGCCVGSQPMWRSSLHEELGYFDETLDCAADWDFWLRVSEGYCFKHIPEFLGLYYFNREGIEHGNEFHSYYERHKVGKRYGTSYISTFETYHTGRNRLVSVILPAYNAEKYIRQAIESVLIQNYRNFELVIINDGSTDGTEEIVRSYKDDHIRYFKQANRGLAATHNEGIRQSRGEFLIKVDADDFIAVDFIGRHLTEFYEHQDADVVYCDDYLVEEDSKPIRIIKRPEYADRRILIRDLFRAGFPVVPFRTCIRRRVFDKIGLFDETLRIGEDYDMMRRFVKAGLKAHHLKAALYYRRLASESLSRQYSVDKARAHFGIVKSYAETFSHDELFPEVQWEQIPSGMRQLHFKCLVAMNFISLGQSYIEVKMPNYAGAALQSAGEQLRGCLEIDPGNGNIRKLIDRCERLEGSLSNAVLVNA